MSFWNKYRAYIHDNPNHYWFRRKIWGWGWTPATWQGWAILGVYIVALAGFALTLDERSTSREVLFTFVLPMVLLTATLIRIAYKTGEPPKWQWGIPDDTKEEMSEGKQG
jgi:hypothetical protein